MTPDEDRAERDCATCLFDSCITHDVEHYRRALAAWQTIPHPRSSDDSTAGSAKRHCAGTTRHLALRLDSERR